MLGKTKSKRLFALFLMLAIICSQLTIMVAYADEVPDALVFPAIYPESAIKPLDWDDPELDALAWGVVRALTDEELYDLQGGSSTSRARNTGNWEDSYTWGTGYVHMIGTLGVPVMRFWDGPQGVVTVGHFDTTLPPSEPAAAATWDRDALYKYGTVYGRDNKASAANVQLGSQIDVMRSTHFRRSRDTLSEDPFLGAVLATEFVKGIEDQNVAATLKHVAGYNFDTGTGRDVRVDEQTFHENWMAATRHAIVYGGASAIMSSYNRINLPFYDTWAPNDAPKFYTNQGNSFFPQVGSPNPNATQAEKDYPVGYQAAWDSYLLKDVLRDMYGFQGITMTDWGGNTAFSGFSGTTLETGTISRNTRANFEKAMELGFGTIDDVRLNAYYNLKAIGHLGYLGLVQLDENGVARRGRIEGGYDTIELPYPIGKEREDLLWANEALNLEVLTKGAVLLKNDNNALPLKDEPGKKVAVIGLSGLYALTSHYSEASFGWQPAKFSPLEKLQEMMPLSDVKGYIGVNDIVGEPIPAEYLWAEIERPDQPEFTGDYVGVTPGVNFTVGDCPTSTSTMTNTVTKILPDLKVLTGTNNYKNNETGNGIVKGKAGRVVTYLKAPADGVYGIKILNIGGVAYGNSRISLLGDDMEVESYTNINFTAAPNFGRGSNIPAGSGYGTSSDVCTREGLNIPTSWTYVNLIKDRWYKIETGMWTTLEAKDAQFQINWLPGGNTDASREAAIAAAGVPGTDVIFFAHRRDNGGAANDPNTNTLDPVQLAFLEDVSKAARRAGNKVIFVGNISLAISMPWLDKVDAVLWMWLGGDMVGTATAQLLTGKVNPSGKLPLTFPKDSQQSQFGDQWVRDGNVASPGTYSLYFEGIYGGYKWYDWQNPDGVLFPFGYGLSYTTFELSNLKVVPTPGVDYGYTVSVDVENTGDVAGAEVVQVYLSAPKGYQMPTLDRNKIITDVQIAKKALVQFDKVYLEPGEKKTVTMEVNWEQLMYWDVNSPLTRQPDGTLGKWQPVLGERTFMVGNSSDNLPLTATVVVEPKPSTAKDAVVLTGNSSVQSGDSFKVGINLKDLSQTVHAQDFILTYNPDLFEYVGTEGASEKNIVVRAEESLPGTLRIIAATVGGVTGDELVLNVTFKAKNISQSAVGTIAVSKAELGVAPEGTVVEAALASKTIEIKVPTPGVDKSALSAAINAAQALYDTAEVGIENGQYPEAAKEAFLVAINAAKAVYNDSNATQTEVDNATSALNEAADTFRASVYTDKTADLNNDDKVNIGDLALAAYYYNATPESPNWEAAKVADVNRDGIVDIQDLAFVAKRILD